MPSSCSQEWFTSCMKLDLGSRGELNPSEAAGAQSCLSSSYKQLDEAFRHPDQGRLGAEAAGLCLQHGSSPSPLLIEKPPNRKSWSRSSTASTAAGCQTFLLSEAVWAHRKMAEPGACVNLSYLEQKICFHGSQVHA